MTCFHFVVRRLRWLARIPGAPHLFDAMLLAWTALRHRDRLLAMEAVKAAALEIPGLSLSIHRFGGVGFSLGGRELGHLHGNGLLDLHTGRELARELISAGRAKPHHLFGESGWVSFWVRSAADVPAAIEMLRSLFSRIKKEY